MHAIERRSKTALVRSERFAWFFGAFQSRKRRTRWDLHKEDLAGLEKSSWSWWLSNWTLLWCNDQRLEDFRGHFRELSDLCLVIMCVAAGVSLYIGSNYICTAINYMHIYFITSRVYRSGTCRCTCKSSLGVLTSGQSEGKVSPVPDHNRQYE